MPSPLHGKYIALGVSGSIACHKAVDLASKLTQEGALVDVVMTEAATNFVTALAFRSITHRPAVTSLFDPQSDAAIEHVATAERADVMVVAPATANTIAKLAYGLADDSVSTTALATQAPIIVCPAMDGHMYENPATQENVQKLKSRGHILAGPAEGPLASGLTGLGRMLEVPEIIGHIKLVLGRDGDMAGRKIVVSAGGTREAIDPVRFISNRSSGKQGHAIAEAARDRGARVSLVTAASSFTAPVGVEVVSVETVAEMRDAALAACKNADVLIMAAAVSDFRAAEPSGQKIKKQGGRNGFALQLTQNSDFLSEVPDGVVKIGFAAETEDLKENARAKLTSKGLDLVAANDVTADGSGFATDTNRVILLGRNGDVEDLGLLTKYEVGSRILDRMSRLLR